MFFYSVHDTSTSGESDYRRGRKGSNNYGEELVQLYKKRYSLQ